MLKHPEERDMGQIGQGGNARSPLAALEKAYRALPRTPRVLVVDDQVLHITVINQALGHLAKVFSATTGAQAIKLLPVVEPDLVLLDYEMLGMNGLEVLHAIRRLGQFEDLPVIFVTSNQDEEIEMNCLSAGAVDFIAKPVSGPLVIARTLTHLKLKFQSDLLRDGAYLDPVTGIHNRRYVDLRMAEEWGRSLRDDLPLSLLMVDVDYFKRYNDRYGHPRGDEVLRQVASLIKSKFRRTMDLVARYGGEEFLLLLPETPLVAAMDLARSLVEAIEALGVEHVARDAPHVITVSVGVSERRAGRLSSPAHLLESADQSLYLAKHRGRNTCACLLADAITDSI